MPEVRTPRACKTDNRSTLGRDKAEVSKQRHLIVSTHARPTSKTAAVGGEPQSADAFRNVHEQPSGRSGAPGGTSAPPDPEKRLSGAPGAEPAAGRTVSVRVDQVDALLLRARRLQGLTTLLANLASGPAGAVLKIDAEAFEVAMGSVAEDIGSI